MSSQFVAHRGYQKKFPENTLLAMEEAVSAGAKYLELDVQLSADGVAFIHHDETLQRMCGVDGIIHQWQSQDLSKLFAYEPERFGEKFSDQPLSRLRDLVPLLQQHPDVQCYVEIKDHNRHYFSSEEVLSSVHTALEEVFAQCIIISFDTVIIDAAHKKGWPRLGWVLSDVFQYHELMSREPFLETVFCNVNYLPKYNNKLQFDEPWDWVIYEITDSDLAKKLLGQGVKRIETFAVKEMIAAFA